MEQARDSRALLNAGVFVIFLIEAIVAVLLVSMTLEDYGDTTGIAALLVLASFLLGGVALMIHAGGEARQDTAPFQRFTATLVRLSWALVGLSLVRLLVSAYEAWL